MARVLLVKPRYFGPEFQSITHPMGLMYVAASLRQAGHLPAIHDCAADRNRPTALAETIERFKPDVIGISVIVSELEQTGIIVQTVRRMAPEKPIVFGGPWPSANPERAINDFDADFVVIGEGEHVFPGLVDAIESGHPADTIATEIDGIAVRTFSGPVVKPGTVLTETELDSLPRPAWDLLDHELYASTPSMAGVGCRPYMTVITSRGCPYRCAYCHRTLGKAFRRRSAASVIAELKELRFVHGFREFEIVDDCFNLDRERMHAILSAIRDEIGDIGIHFPNGLRSDRLDPEDVHLLKQAGTVSACFAIETATPRIQKIINKNLDIEKASAAIDAAVREGIYSTGFFMIGLPTETLHEARSTVSFAAGSRLHRAIFMITTPFAGTDLESMAADMGKPLPSAKSSTNLNYFTSSINISAMTDDDLHRVFRSAYRHFYMKPSRILRLIFRHPRALSLPRYALMTAVKILPGRGRLKRP